MMRRVAVVLLAMAFLAVTALAPRRAAADDDNLQYIIPAAVAGVVAVVLIVAILMADRTEPEYELTAMPPPPSRDEPRPAIRLAPHCRSSGDTVPLLCW